MRAYQITDGDKQAYLETIARQNTTIGGKRAALALLGEVVESLHDAGVSSSEMFDCISQNHLDTGVKLLTELLGIMCRFLSAWGTAAILALGVFQLGQTAASTGSWIWRQIKKIGTMASAIVPIASGFKPLMAGMPTLGVLDADAPAAAAAGGSEDPIADVMKFISDVILAKMPVIGSLIKAFESKASDMGAEMIAPLGGVRRQDRAYDRTDRAYDEGEIFDPARPDQEPIESDEIFNPMA